MEPLPILTEAGIVGLYTGRIASECVDRLETAFEYAGDMAALGPEDLKDLLSRSEKPFFSPPLPWGCPGRYQAGATFPNGLLPFRGEWFFYSARQTLSWGMREQKRLNQPRCYCVGARSAPSLEPKGWLMLEGQK